MTAGPYGPIPSSLLISRLSQKPRVFVSYHHGGDQEYYNRLAGMMALNYVLVSDNSLDRLINSDNVDYVMRHIRENYISGTSCTIILCGLETPYRKYVDWEIDATLQKQHALVGLRLPTLPLQPNGGTIKPARLQDNIDSGYATWGQFADVMSDPQVLVALVHAARLRPNRLINNARARRLRNG